MFINKIRFYNLSRFVTLFYIYDGNHVCHMYRCIKTHFHQVENDVAKHFVTFHEFLLSRNLPKQKIIPSFWKYTFVCDVPLFQKVIYICRKYIYWYFGPFISLLKINLVQVIQDHLNPTFSFKVISLIIIYRQHFEF